MTEEISPFFATRLRALPDLVNADPVLMRRGAMASVDWMIVVGQTPCHLTTINGRIEACDLGKRLMRSWRFAIRGGEDAWRAFWQPLPEPGSHDLFALSKSGRLSIEGDLAPLMTHLLYFKGVIETPRRMAEEA